MCDTSNGRRPRVASASQEVDDGVHRLNTAGASRAVPDSRRGGNTKRSARVLLGALVLLSAIALDVVPAAAERFCSSARYTWKVSEQQWINKPTNVFSDYLRGPGTISYTASKTAVSSASLSATVSAEAGIVLAKASTSVGTTVGKSWSSTQTWSYTKPVPAGTTARLRLFHRSLQFRASKYRLTNNGCTLGTRVHTSVNTAPVKASNNTWMLQRSPYA